MILPILMVALAMTGQSVQSFECGNIVTRTSDFWSNAAGVRVALKVHTEDDHAKNSHQCESDYTLLIVRPDGTSAENQMYSVIDNWSRPIRFWIDGFAAKGHKLIATTVEGGSWQLLVYDLNGPDRAPEVYEISKEFLDALSHSCRDSLRAVGMTQEGNPVIAGNDAACSETRRLWKVKHGHRMPAGNLGAGGASMHDQAIPLSNRAAFEPLEPRQVPSM
jgi:hypothetical protein